MSFEQKFRAIRQRVEALPKEQRGATIFNHVQVGAPVASADLSEATVLDNDISVDFDNVEEARRYRERLLEPQAQPDDTIPVTATARKAHVQALFRAFKAVDPNSEEGENVKKPFLKQTHENTRVEVLAWEILDACIRRSLVTMNLVESYEPEKFKFKKGADLDFAQRFDLIVQGMSHSKAMCKHMFDTPYIFKVVDDPQSNAERIDSNRKLNGQKAQVMKRGKEVVEQEERAAKATGKNKRVKTEHDDEDDAGEYDEDNTSDATPTASTHLHYASSASDPNLFTAAHPYQSGNSYPTASAPFFPQTPMRRGNLAAISMSAGNAMASTLNYNISPSSTAPRQNLMQTPQNPLQSALAVQPNSAPAAFMSHNAANIMSGHTQYGSAQSPFVSPGAQMVSPSAYYTNSANQFSQPNAWLSQAAATAAAFNTNYTDNATDQSTDANDNSLSEDRE
jgi:hypothetical protein